ncbi:MgtC/SapB family protein [Dasania sp. GY-MA-18]|uniref:Protein MgtC n=1 Tax=Dasania phycosphaerae TaxID=2950436 RepID=A0A9J6RLT4_9GAMM|nr:MULTISPECIES: MgtC/SapB family protein [Dasania]MCR8922842.1 MgtC/SapB family protein [Dasania sp. GY-MA-18]MCZ0865273.1 MgtC/SapB family protein [Dasania phycosphaerae]MCZ0868998.1 MgtC/SapB family protein [Dasania phycosphaerae]
MFFDISPYNWHSIAVALFCGAIIGLERQLRGKPVGIRTSSLIILGTYLFVATSFLISGEQVDTSRVIGQVITGVGFLGAGVMLAKDGAVVGVTSASTIWVLASLGVLVACDHLLPAIKLSILVVMILYGVDILEERTVLFSRGVHTRVNRYRESKRGDRDRRQGE